MRLVENRGEPQEAHGESLPTAGMPDWESIRVFLETVRCGSFRSAADRLAMSFSVLRRRVAQLETDLGTILLTRHIDGVRLTPEGERIVAAARQMESAAFGVLRANYATAPEISGEVKIAVTEGTGTFWLAPRLVELQRAYPKLLVNLKCAMTPADVSTLEADVAIQLMRPHAPEQKVVRLGCLHTMPFAAESYIKTYGLPKTVDELRMHRFVLHVAEQTQTKTLFEQLFPGLPWVGTVALQTNVASAHLWAVAKGAGIGWLPTYSHLISGRIVPIEVGPRFVFDVWLTYHPDVAKIARVRRVIDWVKDSFDAQKYPWFGEHFVHPNDLPKSYRGGPLVNMFEGFIHQDGLPQKRKTAVG